jgi:hypothetical protein
MSDHKKEAKAASAAKMQRMGLKLDDGSKSFDDMRGGSPFEGLNSGNAGKMPITPSRFKRGGKVSKHANLEGAKAKHNLGKAPRKAAGGSNNMPVPVPPRKDDSDYNPYPYKLTKAQMAALHESEHPDDPSDLGSKESSYARGGLSNMNPAKRKAAIGAMVARKKKLGLPATQPTSRGILPSVPMTPMSGLVPSMNRKHGGSAKHPDVAEDKKLVKKMVKPSALKDRAEKCWGGEAKRSKKMNGGSLTAMNPMMQRPMMQRPMMQRPGVGQPPMGQGPFNPMGNRPMRASGGRTKGKTNVNIIISPQSGQTQPLGAGVGMGQPPVPPMMPPMGGMPPGGMPPMMPPAPPMGGAPGGGLPPQLMAAMAGRGGMPPMARKSGGRVGQGMPKYQEKDYGSGSGLGRLEKKKWPTANGTE